MKNSDTHGDDGSIIEDVVLSQESGKYGVDIHKNRAVWKDLEGGGGREVEGKWWRKQPVLAKFALASKLFV